MAFKKTPRANISWSSRDQFYRWSAHTQSTDAFWFCRCRVTATAMSPSVSKQTQCPLFSNCIVILMFFYISEANPHLKISFDGRTKTKKGKVYLQTENLKLIFTTTRYDLFTAIDYNISHDCLLSTESTHILGTFTTAIVHWAIALIRFWTKTGKRFSVNWKVLFSKHSRWSHRRY